MKLKTILLVASLATAAAFGQVLTGVNECGVMHVESSTANTIIAVPWVEVGSGEAIKVANLVMTDNLTVGDQLFVYDSNNWFAFVLAEEAGVKSWDACTTVAANGIPAATGAQDKALAQGTALFIKRQNTEAPIYLYGQVNASVDSKTAAAGSAGTPAYTLLASPKAEAFNLNGSGKVTGAVDGDMVIIPQNGGANIVYTLKSGQWGRNVEKSVTKYGETMTQQEWQAAEAIPMGTGFWYVSKGGNATFAW